MRYFVLIYTCFVASIALGETYTWVDAQGVTHFSDNPSSISQESLPTLQKKEITGGGTIEIPSAGEVSHSQTVPVNDKDEQYWRSSFMRLRSAIGALSNGLPEKQDNLENLRRRRLLYHKASDRVKITEIEDEIKRDEARIKELESQLQDLELKASRAGIPLEWRQ